MQKQNRRVFLRNGTGAAMLSSFAPMSSLAQASTTKMKQAVLNQLRRVITSKTKPLTLMFPWGSRSNVEVTAKAFTKETGVQVQLVESPMDELASRMVLTSQMRTKATKIDIGLSPTYSVPDLAHSGIIRDLTELANEYEPIGFRDSYISGLGSDFSNRLYGYQCDGDAYFVFFRRSWLENENNQKAFQDRYGIPLKIPQTWTDFDKQVEFFTNPKRGQLGGLLFRNFHYGVHEFWVRMHGLGVLPFNSEMEPQIASVEAEEALGNMLSITKFMPAQVFRQTWNQNHKEFMQGKVFCNFGWGGTQKMFRNDPLSKVAGDIVVASLPTGSAIASKVGIPYFNWGWNYTVAEQATQVDLAYLFCLYASLPSVSTRSVEQEDGYLDPFRREHYSDLGIEDVYGRDFLGVHEVAMENAIPSLFMRGQRFYLGALRHAVGHACSLKMSPKKALGLAETKWRGLTEKLGVSEQRQQWLELRRQYPPKFRESK